MTKEEVEEEQEPLSPMARLFQSPGIDLCIITMIGFKARINPDVILDDLKNNVSKHPRFSSKLSDNGARWIKTKVNVEDHVFTPDIDPQEINEDGEGFVVDYISRLTLIPLNRSRPLWDIHILNVKTSDAEAVGVMRCHHSLGDGMSLMSLLVASTKKLSNPKEFPTIPAIKRREKIVLHCHGNKGCLLRSIFTIYSATINDVLLGVTQAALSRYLNQRYSDTDGKSTSDLNNLPGRIRLRAGVAVNLRQEIGVQHVADMLAKGSKCRWGNYDSVVFVPLSISLETDPLVPLLKAKSIMDRKKHSLYAAMLYSIIEYILNIFGPKVFKRPCSNTTTSFSNIVGPVEKVSLHGNQIAYIALSCYGQSQALLIHFISYAEKMVISIAVDPKVIPDPEKIFNEMEESLRAMKDALSGKSDRIVG